MWMPASGFPFAVPLIEAAVVCSAFLTTYLFIRIIYIFKNRERFAYQARLQNLESQLNKEKREADELSKPFVERIGRPLVRMLARQTGRLMPQRTRVVLQKKLTLAGNPGSLTPNEFLGIQYGLALCIGIAWVLFVPLFKLSGNSVMWGMGLGMVSGFFLPDLYLRQKAAFRKDEIERSLPDVLDLLTVSVEAGLGFDAALHKVVEKVKGTVSEEFYRTLQESQMGKPRREALRDLANRVGVDELTTFVGAVIQADQLGVSIGNVLRIQSEQIRRKRRQKAEELAMKAPIKMLLPLVLFIFPTIFIVLLGPAVIQIIETFGK